MSTQEDLANELTSLGYATTRRTLEEWRLEGLLPKLEKVGLGRGRGTQNQVSDFAATLEQAIAIHNLRKRGCRGDVLLLSLFFLGFPVDAQEARKIWSETLDRIAARLSRISNKHGGISNFIGKWAAKFGREKFEVPGFGRQARIALALEIGSLIFDPEFEFEIDANYDLIILAYRAAFSFFRVGGPKEILTEREIEELAQFLQTAFSFKSIVRLAANATESEFADAQSQWMRAVRLSRPLLSNPNGLSRYLPKERGEPLIAIGPIGIAGILYLAKFDESDFASKVLGAFEKFLIDESASLSVRIPVLIADLRQAENTFEIGGFQRKIANFQA